MNWMEIAPTLTPSRLDCGRRKKDSHEASWMAKTITTKRISGLVAVAILTHSSVADLPDRRQVHRRLRSSRIAGKSALACSAHAPLALWVPVRRNDSLSWGRICDAGSAWLARG